MTAVCPVVIKGNGIWVGWSGLHDIKKEDVIPESDPNDQSPTAGLRSDQVCTDLLPRPDLQGGLCSSIGLESTWRRRLRPKVIIVENGYHPAPSRRRYQLSIITTIFLPLAHPVILLVRDQALTNTKFPLAPES